MAEAKIMDSIRGISMGLEKSRVNGNLKDYDLLYAINEIRELNLPPKFRDISVDTIKVMRMDEYIYKTSVAVILNIARRKVYIHIQNCDKDLLDDLSDHWKLRGFKFCQSMLQTEEDFTIYELEW